MVAVIAFGPAGRRVALGTFRWSTLVSLLIHPGGAGDYRPDTFSFRGGAYGFTLAGYGFVHCRHDPTAVGTQ